VGWFLSIDRTQWRLTKAGNNEAELEARIIVMHDAFRIVNAYVYTINYDGPVMPAEIRENWGLFPSTPGNDMH
jgi:hypothetical protein